MKSRGCTSLDSHSGVGGEKDNSFVLVENVDSAWGSVIPGIRWDIEEGRAC